MVFSPPKKKYRVKFLDTFYAYFLVKFPAISPPYIKDFLN